MCRFYFKYRCAAKSNALQNIEWQPALLNHPIQNDSYNCGVFVLQVSIVTDYDAVNAVTMDTAKIFPQLMSKS